MASSAKAQEQHIIFYEDFENMPGPTAGGKGNFLFRDGWRLFNVDGTTSPVALYD